MRAKELAETVKQLAPRGISFALTLWDGSGEVVMTESTVGSIDKLPGSAPKARMAEKAAESEGARWAAAHCPGPILQGLARRWADDPTSVSGHDLDTLFGWVRWRTRQVTHVDSQGPLIAKLDAIANDLQLHVADADRLCNAAGVDGWLSDEEAQELARRWADWQVPNKGLRLDGYEREALFGWVRRWVEDCKDSFGERWNESHAALDLAGQLGLPDTAARKLCKAAGILRDEPAGQSSESRDKPAAPSSDAPTAERPAVARTWAEFREAGMLWWVNRLLHVFGWAILVEVDEETGEVDVHPMRALWRGFPSESEARGFERVTKWMRDHAEQLQREVGESE